MRTILTLILAAMLCGCMGPQGEQTTTTLPAPKTITLDEVKTQAILYVQTLPGHDTQGCNEETVSQSTTAQSCTNCFEITIEYKCPSNDTPGARELRRAYVKLAGANVTGYNEIKVGLLCLKDSDCLPKKPQDGVDYSCEKGICSVQALTSQASKHCIEAGYKVVARNQLNGGTYNVCVFPNGNECEEWQYLYGNCDPSSGNLTSCIGYPAGQICATDYIPVCAQHIISGNESDIQWVDFNNPCSACTTQTKDKRPKGYVMGTCPPTTSTTLGIKSFMDAAAQYCEQMGYSFRIRKYLSGNEYGVCVFGVDDECDAQDYFHGRCKPKNPN